MGWVNLDHAQAEAQDVGDVPMMLVVWRDEGCRRRSGVWDRGWRSRDELVDFGTESDDFGSDIVDEGGAVDSQRSR